MKQPHTEVGFKTLVLSFNRPVQTTQCLTVTAEGHKHAETKPQLQVKRLRFNFSQDVLQA